MPPKVSQLCEDHHKFKKKNSQSSDGQKSQRSPTTPCKTVHRIRKIQEQLHVHAMLKKIRLSRQFAMKLRMETCREWRLTYLINIIYGRREKVFQENLILS